MKARVLGDLEVGEPLPTVSYPGEVLSDRTPPVRGRVGPEDLRGHSPSSRLPTGPAALITRGG